MTCCRERADIRQILKACTAARPKYKVYFWTLRWNNWFLYCVYITNFLTTIFKHQCYFCSASLLHKHHSTNNFDILYIYMCLQINIHSIVCSCWQYRGSSVLTRQHFSDHIRWDSTRVTWNKRQQMRLRDWKATVMACVSAACLNINSDRWFLSLIHTQ